MFRHGMKPISLLRQLSITRFVMGSAMIKKVHFVAHSCGPDECDCDPYCHVYAEEIETTGIRKYVTCKRCLRGLEARTKRVLRGDQEAWLY